MKRFVSLLGTFSFFKKLSSLKRHNRPFFACQLSRISPAAVISLFPFRPQKKKIPKTLDHSSTTRKKKKKKKKPQFPHVESIDAQKKKKKKEGEREFLSTYSILISRHWNRLTWRWDERTTHPLTTILPVPPPPPPPIITRETRWMVTGWGGGGICIPHICRALPHSYCHQRKGKERRRRYKKIDHSYRIGKKRQKKGGKKYTSLGRGSIIVSSK